MAQRDFLRGRIRLCEMGSEQSFERMFTVTRKISEGASVICYEAYHDNSSKGILKEFYPRSAYSLERDSQGQLIHAEGFGDAKKRFENAERKYIEAHQHLLEAKRNNIEQDLATFIPAFEIYHGCDADGKITGTTYIWTPEPELETFDVICDEIHKHPEKSPEHKLVTVLAAIESLTKCVCSLHTAEMLHCDIKPENFGFVKRSSETLTQAISLFDINSICSVYDVPEEVMGTPGYMEPEAGYESANNQTDIYAIGAVLFHAIIVTDEVKEGNYLYKSEYFRRLKELVDESELIQASESNAHPRLRNILVTMLQKCLCNRSSRYECCEDLLVDLETAMFYVLPAEIAKKVKSGQKWVLADVEKSFDKSKEKNATSAIQYHLYKKPLYCCVPKNEESMNVMVIGFGHYGQKFLDACLQAGQIKGKKLNVTVVSDNPVYGDITDKELYLSERPELKEFFDIDGAANDEEETSYGSITFKTAVFSGRDRQANALTMRNIICVNDGTKKTPHYMFVALGDDTLNFSVAKACKDLVDALEISCLVNYVREKEGVGKRQDKMIMPVYVNADVKKDPIHCEIERMAFNAHLVWQKDLNIDYKTVRREYLKPYYHRACISNALSVKYKLHSLGIDLDELDFKEAAKLFVASGLATDARGRKIKNELVYAEHRRWVTEKLCAGWTRIRNLEECADGMTKDERNKRHACIVKSRPDQMLAEDFHHDGNKDKWDTASDEEIARLDDLDRMSLELHRVYVRKAGEVKKENLLNGSNIESIRSLIGDDRNSTIAFQEWFVCLKEIWQGEYRKAPLYKGLKDAFLKSAEGLPVRNRRSVTEQVRSLEAMFYPILASSEHRDYKLDDVAFVDSIPFILTYSDDINLVIPYAVGNNTEVFSNVASATVANPERIIYLLYLETMQDVNEFKNTVPHVISYMKKKHLKATVDFVIATNAITATHLHMSFEHELRELGKGRIRQVRLFHREKTECLPVTFRNYLMRRAKNKMLFALEENHTKLSYLLLGAGIYHEFSHYRFDQPRMTFHVGKGCEELTCINKKPYISVADMMALCRSAGKSGKHPEFFADYEMLWRLYNENSVAWKMLCDLLGEYAKDHDVIARFRKKSSREKDEEVTEYRYILPFTCYAAVKKTIDILKTNNIAEKGSRVISYTTDACEIIIRDRCDYKEKYSRLFGNVYALMNHAAVSVNLNTRSHEVSVSFDDLVVNDLQIDGSRKEEFIELLSFFHNKGYIIDLRNKENLFSFTYATQQIKQLLTVAGRILEIYTYHRAKESGKFDDIVSSFEVEWEEPGVKNEFDCIITKGFRTLFVECKARADIQQDYYFKIAGLTERFGINAKAVLIADTQEKAYHDSASVNTMQRKRGSMMDVITIWKPEEIEAIGDTLLEIIDGRYCV